MSSRTDIPYFVHVHVYSDGEIFLLPCTSKGGKFTDIDELKLELAEAQQKDGVVLYSTEDPEQSAREKLVAVTDLILHHDLDVEIVDPHPEVYGYQSSYAPYIEQAVEVAEMDVDGLERFLEDAQKALQTARPGSTNYKDRRKICVTLKKKLKKARTVLDKITSLHIELFVETEGDFENFS